ncbi:YdcF family protein [Romeriopsis navalis]|uniref:YdcF family protein n=1 Tax=Romeriopsis navalis TaxID=2992132 RepID=UPI0021F87B58|nr:YdcF family protein [Romeriopsis navalis]
MSQLIQLLFYPLGLSIFLTLIGLLLLKRRGLYKFGITLLVFALSLLWISSTSLVARSMAQSLEFQNLPKEVAAADAIVVLGGATKSHQAPRTMPEVNDAGDRIIYATRLYKDGKAPKIIVSGGRIPWHGDVGTEADHMASLMELFGVPRSALLEESDSMNTRKNAENIKQMLEKEQLNKLILVTSAIHMPRALAIFRRLEIDVVPAPTDFYSVFPYKGKKASFQLSSLLPQVGNLDLTTRAMKEYIGLWVYRLRGWA